MSTSNLLDPSSSSSIDNDSERQALSAQNGVSAVRKHAGGLRYIPLLVKNVLPLIGAFICATSFGLCLWAAAEGRVPAILGNSYLALVSCLVVFFMGAVMCMASFLSQVTDAVCVDREDSNAAMICSAEVSIDSETTLTVRSWWPRHMSMEDVKRHGKRIAMSSAQRWVADNRQNKCQRIRFSTDAALSLCREHVTIPLQPAGSLSVGGSAAAVCAVCLEDLSSSCDGVKMRQCGHSFHDCCLSAWFVKSSRLRCPMCRSDHNECIPEADLQPHMVKDEPSINIVSMSVEEGILTNNQ